MKDWATLEPDRVKLLNKHFTKGRNGKKIDMVVIHHNAGVLSIDQIWQVWQDRPASAHYQVTPDGEIGQLVWDRDTAWHAANSDINQRSIGIEFANLAGAANDWPISAKTIEEGAHLVAAVCVYYKLGRPKSGTNIRFHSEFTATSCPYHLGPRGKYFPTLMNRATYWYDQMTNPTATPAPSKEITVSEADRIIEHITDFISGFNGPISSDVKDNRQQLTGGRDAGEYPGWPQLGGRTLVDAVALVGEKLGIEGFKAPKK